MIPHNRWVSHSKDEEAVLRVMRSGYVGSGPEVEAFERELAERFRPGGAACCVSSGTAALRIALNLLGEINVSIPTYACTALWHAAFDGMFGPMLCDSELGTFNAPDATVVVHTYGVVSEVPGDSIEDFTHAPGGSIDGRSAGSMGAFSVISFGATKPLGIGAGGAILGDKEAILAAKDIRDYDQKPTLRERFNYQMSDIHASIGRERLRRLGADNARRQEIAQKYWTAIGETTDISKDPSHAIGRTWYRFVVHAKEPSTARGHFERMDIETIVPLRTDELIHRQLGLDPARFPVAEDIAAHTLSLPIYPSMTDEEVDRVCEAIAGLPA